MKKLPDCQIFDAGCLKHKPDARREIVLSERRSEYRGANPLRKKLCVYHIDKCAPMDWPGGRCDYLILDGGGKRAFFIELKDRDILEAVEQLNNSINHLLGSLAGYSVFGRIVPKGSATLDLLDTRYIRLRVRLKKLNGDLRLQNRLLKEEL